MVTKAGAPPAQRDLLDGLGELLWNGSRVVLRVDGIGPLAHEALADLAVHSGSGEHGREGPAESSELVRVTRRVSSRLLGQGEVLPQVLGHARPGEGAERVREERLVRLGGDNRPGPPARIKARPGGGGV